MRILIFAFFLFCARNYTHAQIISQFTFEIDPVTTADIGPNATSISTSAFSGTGGVGGTNGLNAGLPKADMNMIIPTGSGIFDTEGVDVSFDYHREESSGTFFQRGNSLIINGCANLSVSYRVDNGAGGFNAVASGNAFAIPNDDIYRNYRFYYTECDGVGVLLVDGAVVWSNDGPDNRAMYWVGSGNITIGGGVDATGSNKTFFDNLIIADISCSALPIELLNFTAELNSDQQSVALNWETASEISNDYFTIERSANGSEWEELKRVDGAGNSSIYLKYTTRDDSPLFGNSYYRLKQTDFNGEYSFSNPVSISNKNPDLLIYPNPVYAGEQVVINNSEGLEEIELALFSIAGKKLVDLKLEATSSRMFVFTIPEWIQSGTYFLIVGEKKLKIVIL